MGECLICLPDYSGGGWVDAQYVYLHIQRVDGRMLNMYTYTFMELMGEC